MTALYDSGCFQVVNRRTDVVRGFSPNLLSGLPFAGANRPAIGEGDDGILIAEEIALYYWGGVRAQ